MEMILSFVALAGASAAAGFDQMGFKLILSFVAVAAASAAAGFALARISRHAEKEADQEGLVS